jgi:hypothetical protein
MTTRTLVGVLIRVIGLYLLVATAVALPSQVAYLLVPAADDYGGALVRASMMGGIASILGSALMGFALYFKSQRVAEIVVPQDSGAIAFTGGDQLYLAALALIGVWLVVGGLQDVAATGTALFLIHDRGERDFIFDREAQGLARGIMAVIAGAVLIISPERLYAVWASFRGISHDEE